MYNKYHITYTLYFILRFNRNLKRCLIDVSSIYFLLKRIYVYVQCPREIYNENMPFTTHYRYSSCINGFLEVKQKQIVV